MNNEEDDAEVTSWKLYRVAYSWEDQKWAIYEQVDTTLVLIRGFWDNEPEAHTALNKINTEQGAPI